MNQVTHSQPSVPTYAIYGAMTGAVMALSYGLIVTFALAIGVAQSIQQDSATAHGLIADSLFALLGIGVPALVVITLVGIIPSTLLGSLTGICVRWASLHWNRQVSWWRAWAIGIGTASIFATALYILLLGFGIELGTVLLLLGPPSLFYVAASGWGSWKLQSQYRHRQQRAP